MERFLKTVGLLAILFALVGCGDSYKKNVSEFGSTEIDSDLSQTDETNSNDSEDTSGTGSSNNQGGGATLGADLLQVPDDAGTEVDCTDGKGHDVKSLCNYPHLNDIGMWEVYHELRIYDDQEVKVAVLDQVFNDAHSDIQDQIVLTHNFNRQGCMSLTDADTNPDCEVVFPDQIPDSKYLGSFNHGTNIAGVIAANGVYGKGAIGVNPSAKLVLLGRDSRNNNLNALAGAIEAGVDVISMSWPLGKPPGDLDVPEFRALLEEAAEKGIVTVMAAGNRKIDVDQEAIYPTRYAEIEGVIAVGASSGDELFSTMSNYGKNYVGIAAPGTVLTTGGNYVDAEYSLSTGTSFSGPLVAGAVSRIIQGLKSKGLAVVPSQVEEILYRSANQTTGLEPYFTSGGKLSMPGILRELESL